MAKHDDRHRADLTGEEIGDHLGVAGVSEPVSGLGGGHESDLVDLLGALPRRRIVVGAGGPVVDSLGRPVDLVVLGR
jgi:hypothetical protein